MKNGLVFLIHGYGSNGTDMFGLSKELSSISNDYDFISPDAPFQCETHGRFHWFPIDEITEEYFYHGIQNVEPIVNKMVDTYANNYEKIIFAGFSQGAALAVHLGLTSHKKVAGVISFAGGFVNPDNIVAKNARQTPPICLIHGNKDSILPHTHSLKAYKDLKTNGFDVEINLIDGLDHSINTACIDIANNFLIKKCK